MDANETNDIICQILTEYLERNRLRKTPERYEILKAVYTFEGHFTMEALQNKMKDEIKFHVSRATLYNTVKHLILANLLVQHAFPHASQFEKVYGVQPHLHRICTKGYGEYQPDAGQYQTSSVSHLTSGGIHLWYLLQM